MGSSMPPVFATLLVLSLSLFNLPAAESIRQLTPFHNPPPPPHYNESLRPPLPKHILPSFFSLPEENSADYRVRYSSPPPPKKSLRPPCSNPPPPSPKHNPSPPYHYKSPPPPPPSLPLPKHIPPPPPPPPVHKSPLPPPYISIAPETS